VRTLVSREDHDMMIAWLVMGALADVLFESVAARNRGYEACIEQYLDRFGGGVPPRTRRLRTR
jgi:hypothetical protein